MAYPTKTVWVCDECEYASDEPSGVKLYECGECGDKFSANIGGGKGNRCEQCRKFATKVSDNACDDCEAAAQEEQERIMCPECNEKTFSDEDELVAHAKEQHADAIADAYAGTWLESFA